MQFALRDPARVSALALVASAGLGREIHPVVKSLCSPGFGDWATAWAITPLGQFQRTLWRAFGSFSRLKRAPIGWFVNQLWLGAYPQILWDQLLLSRVLIDQEGQKEVMLDRLPNMSVPALIVWGESDQILPVAHGRAAAGRIPHSRLAIIPDCGHMPHVERPEAFLEAVLSFLEGLRPRPIGLETTVRESNDHSQKFVRMSRHGLRAAPSIGNWRTDGGHLSIQCHKVTPFIRDVVLSVNIELPLDQSDAGRFLARHKEPTLEDAVALADELEWALSRLNVFGRRVLNRLARFREGEPPGEPISQAARTEPRPPRITKAHLELRLQGAQLSEIRAPHRAFGTHRPAHARSAWHS